jgi:hypothetical protein
MTEDEVAARFGKRLRMLARAIASDVTQHQRTEPQRLL